MSDSSAKETANIESVFRVYIHHALRYPFLLLFAFVSAIGLQITALAAPLYLRQFFNVLATRTPDVVASHQLIVLLGILSFIWLCDSVIERIQYRILMHFQLGVAADLYSTAFNYLIDHSYHFFISHFAGSLTHKISKFTRAFESMFDAILTEFFATLLFVVGAVVILFIHNPLLGTMLGIWTVLFMLFQIYVATLRQPSRVVASASDTKLTATLADAISNHATIMLFSGEKAEAGTFRSVVRARGLAFMRVWSVDNFIWMGIGIFTLTIQVALLYGAIILWGRGLLTVGDFILIQAYLLTTFVRLASINRTLRRFYDALADAEEMVAILEEPHDVQDTPHATTLNVSHGEIIFDDVQFHFHESKPLLHNFNLTVRAGEKVALVGSSGAGKSTITKLLLRLYDVMGGRILIDDQVISDVTQESLRDAIGFVPQEPILFHRSLMENIRYGKRNATDEEVMEAARQAHCHEFIIGLPGGYETYVGERGVKLSGGERQRVAIARAILKNAPILILDEATSSLDSESEALIQDSLELLMRGKTVLVIAHRLSTIMKMDRIIVLDGGDVTAQGTHAQLLKRGGLYQKLWSIQAGGFLQDGEGEE